MENVNNDLEMRKTFARRLKRLRLDRELTLQDLAAKLNEKYNLSVTFGSLGNYERAYRIPDLFLLSKLADFFDVTTDYLIGQTDIKNAKVIQTTIFDNDNKPHDVKIGVAKGSELEDMTVKEVQELVKKLKNLGIDFEKIN